MDGVRAGSAALLDGLCLKSLSQVFITGCVYMSAVSRHLATVWVGITHQAFWIKRSSMHTNPDEDICTFY